MINKLYKEDSFLTESESIDDKDSRRLYSNTRKSFNILSLKDGSVDTHSKNSTNKLVEIRRTNTYDKKTGHEFHTKKEKRKGSKEVDLESNNNTNKDIKVPLSLQVADEFKIRSKYKRLSKSNTDVVKIKALMHKLNNDHINE